MRFAIQLQYRQKTLLWVSVEIGLDETMRLTVLRKFFNFSLWWLEGDSFSFCLIDSFFLIKLSMTPDIQGMRFRPFSLLFCI